MFFCKNTQNHHLLYIRHASYYTSVSFALVVICRRKHWMISSTDSRKQHSFSTQSVVEVIYFWDWQCYWIQYDNFLQSERQWEALVVFSFSTFNDVRSSSNSWLEYWTTWDEQNSTISFKVYALILQQSSKTQLATVFNYVYSLKNTFHFC